MRDSRPSVPLTDLERRTYRLLTDDGIGDLLLGLGFLGFGLTAATDFDFAPVLVLLLAPAIWRGLRRAVVEPRVGYVRLRSDRVSALKQRKQLLAGVLFGFALVVWSVDRALGDQRLPETARPVAMALFLGVPLCVGGYLFELGRLYVYAAVFLFLAALTSASGWPAGTAIFSVGGAMLAYGVVAMLVFVRRHPVLDVDCG